MGHWSCERLSLVILSLLLFSGPNVSEGRTFKLVNNCKYTVWPGTLSNAGQQSLLKGGFVLAAGASQEVTAPVGWAGRFWGRTGCSFDSLDAGTCHTGDCGRGLYCDGAGGIPPATLAEFTLDGYGSQDFYDVSLVDGYNLPLSIVQTGGSGKCGNPGCTSDLNLNCPSDLAVVINASVVSCKSACEAFQTDRYCCAGAYNSPSLCGPTEYSKKFKEACPTAYSYAYDDGSSTFTCTGGGYEIHFCPSGTSTGGGGTPSPVSAPSPLSPPTQNSPPPVLPLPTQAPPPASGLSPPGEAVSLSPISTPPPPFWTSIPPPGITQLSDPPNTSSVMKSATTGSALLSINILASFLYGTMVMGVAV